MLLITIGIGIMHLLVDSVKYYLLKQKKVKNTCSLFVGNQVIHILILFVTVYIISCKNVTLGYIQIVRAILVTFGYDAEIIARWLLAFLLIHKPVNIFIQKFIGDYKPRDKEKIISGEKKSGRRIGTIERLVMLIFLVQDQYTALGFVLTEKSIARYDRISKEKEFAEYYLLGTLISALFVIICRLLVF